MVRYAQEYGLGAAALEFGTTRKTVRLWSYRYLKDGVKGLSDRSRAPKRIPHKTSSQPGAKTYNSDVARRPPVWAD